MLAVSNDSYIIFASDAPTEMTKEILKTYGIGFKQLKGRYKGVDETSFIVNERDANKIGALGIITNQESILSLGAESKQGRPANLIFQKGLDIISLGHMKEVTKEYAEKQEAFTYDPTENKYFVAE